MALRCGHRAATKPTEAEKVTAYEQGRCHVCTLDGEQVRLTECHLSGRHLCCPCDGDCRTVIDGEFLWVFHT